MTKLLARKCGLEIGSEESEHRADEKNETFIYTVKSQCRPLHLVVFLLLVVNVLSAQSVPPPPGGQPAPSAPSTSAADAIVLPPALSDPIEPFNRAMWGFNKGLMAGFVKPVSKGYREVVPKPVRTGIGNGGRNLLFPVRFVNELLQGTWKGANDEVERCLCNTIFGLGGLFDVATRWDIPKRNAGFGQTFQKWGWQPGAYIMLPIFGPSDVRDGTGLVGDIAANPMTYFDPFSYINPGVTANNFTDTVDEDVRFSQSEADSYSILQYAWTFSHVNRKPDLQVNGSQDQAMLETFQSFFFSYKDPEFLSRAKTRSVLIPATGRKLPFTFWLQKGSAPVVYLIPGLGGHRLAGNELGLAELLVKNGFSVVCISSVFHPEFMENASTMDLPSYPPTGVADMHRALTEIDRKLSACYPNRLGARVLMGYSMGAFQTLFLAANAASNQPPLLQFQRYVAIDSPVRLRYAATNLDRYYQAALDWPAAERTSDIENTLLKVVAVSQRPPEQRENLPFNVTESKFLVGLSFHLTLRDIIFSSQLRHNQGVLRLPLDKSRRRAVYDEILQYSFRDFIDKFATPYDKTLGIDLTDPEVVDRATDLKGYAAELQGNPNIRLILNRNDFLLGGDDLAWIESTFAPSQVTQFPTGGHLGNLSQPAVQQAILHALDGLGFPKGKPTSSVSAE